MSSKTIDARGAGMGDLVVGLWVAEGARKVGEKIAFLECSRADIVRAFGFETVSEPSEDCMSLGSGTNTYNEELQTAVLDQSPRPVRWQKTVGWEFEPSRPKLGSLPDEAMGWAEAMAGPNPSIVVAPRSHYDSRTMPLQKWLRVVWSLHKEGIRTVAIDGSKEHVQAFPFYAFGFGWWHILALLAEANVVAGNDSGIAHLSGTIGTPTVVPMGPTHPDIVFGHCYDVLSPVQQKSVECAGCHFSVEKGYQLACDHGCEALQSLPWQRVRDAIMQSVEVRKEAIA
jgi:hypothetical protein